MGTLVGKTAIVTGAGRHKGLGSAIARKLAAEGANIVIADIGSSHGELFPSGLVAEIAEMDAVAASIRDAGGSAIAVGCDVRDEAQVEAMVASTVDSFGGVDILVNNAGVGYLMSLIQDMTLEEWNTVQGVNLTGIFLCTKHVLRRLLDQKRGGRIINIASQGAKSGMPFASAYVSSKHGVVGFTRAAAAELGRHNITVNAVCPNHVTTDLGAWQNEFFSTKFRQSPDDYMVRMRSRIPLRRIAQPDDIANVCAFLASDAASYVTGEAMNVSGGEEMH